MASPLATKRLTRELQSLLKNPLTSPKISATPHESNILEWHYVLEGPSDPSSPYHGGIYHGKLLFPKEYPYKPPGVMMLTPNGRFKPNRRLCLSMSDFHPETWNPMWSISTILTGLYSFMVETAPTMGSVETTAAVKRSLARDSLEWNLNKSGDKKQFRNLFPEYVDLWEERKKKLNSGVDSTSSTSSNDGKQMPLIPSEGGLGYGDGNGVYAFGAGIVALLSILFAIRFF